MERVSRRAVLFGAVGLVGLGLGGRQAGASGRLLDRRAYRAEQGSDMAGWETVVGDGIYAAAGEPPVALDDLATIHRGHLTELQANARRRVIMAHNITFRRIIDKRAFAFVHTARVAFRLPFVPLVGDPDLNAQTLEFAHLTWDGGGSRLDRVVGLQWLLNPWMPEFGDLRRWTGTDWLRIGWLKPDTAWHTAEVVVDYPRGAASITVDGQRFPSPITATARPATWGPETASRCQVEIVSLYPEPAKTSALDRAEFRDWSWTWDQQAASRLYVPWIAH